MVRVYGTFGRSDSRKGSRRRARGGVERDAGQLIDAGWRLYQRFYRVEWGNCTGSQGLPVPIGGILPSTHLGVVVNPQKAEALGVAVGPLEVIHQAPGHVATDIGTLFTRLQKRAHVVVQVGVAVDVANTAVFAHLVRP